MNIIEIILGDTSGDGHCMTDKFVIESGFSVKEIEDAYQNAVKILGFDFINVCCEEYEDDTLDVESQKALLKIPEIRQMIQEDWGIEDLEAVDKDGNYKVFSDFSTSSYTDIFLSLVKCGNPQFSYTKENSPKTIKIGGYGLFI